MSLCADGARLRETLILGTRGSHFIVIPFKTSNSILSFLVCVAPVFTRVWAGAVVLEAPVSPPAPIS